MIEIMQQLRNEHEVMISLLNILEKQVNLIKADDQADLQLVSEIAEYFTGFPEECHHPKEELIYDTLKTKDSEIYQAIENMPEEHRISAERANTLSKIINQIVDNLEISKTEFVTTAADFIQFQRDHIALEENWFFPKVEQELTTADWADIAERCMDTKDPIIDVGSLSHFENLRQAITETVEYV